MEKISTFYDKDLGSDALNKFLILMDEDDRHLLKTSTSLLIFGLHKYGLPLGLAIFNTAKGFPICELKYFYVVEDNPETKLKQTFFYAIEQELKQKKMQLISFLFPEEKNTRHSIPRFFIENGWSPPERFMMRLDFDGYNFNPPWFKRPYPFPEGYEIFPWNEVTEEERHRINFLSRQNHFDSAIYPFREEPFIQPINSLGLRHHKVLVGWIITHTFPDHPQTIRYSSFFIEPEHQFHGSSILLLMESIRRQQKAAVQWAYCEVNYKLSDSNWIRFVSKRLAPYTTAFHNFMRILYKIK